MLSACPKYTTYGFAFILVCFLCVGCSTVLSSEYWEQQPDNVKVASTGQEAINPFTLGGISKPELKKRFGNPDSKETFLDKSELWIYEKTRQGNTLKFAFNKNGALKTMYFNSRIINLGSNEPEDLARKALEN